MSDLSVRKRRSVNRANEGTTVDTERIGIDHITQYLRNLLEERNKTGRRVMSPLTERRVEELLSLCQAEDLSPGARTAIAFAKEELEIRLRAEWMMAFCLDLYQRISMQA